MNSTQRTLLCSLLLLSAGLFGRCPHATAGNAGRRIVRVADYGLQPGTGENALPIIRKILDEHCNDKALQIRFAPGRYDFFPDPQRQAAGQPTTALDLERMRNVEIDGQGCDWIFHGLMKPLRLMESRNVTIRNLRIDWQHPYNSQATIIRATDTYLDMEIDTLRYPYAVQGDSLVFIGEYGIQRIVPEYANLYDGTTHELVYQTRDVPLGREMFRARVSDLGGNRVRFHCRPAMKPDSGTVIVFHHGRYIVNGIEIFDSEQVRIEEVTIHHTLSCGVSAVRTRNIAMIGLDIVADERAGRMFSTIADATHFIGCTGTIRFDGCTVSGSGDDFTNVHGMYAPVTEVCDEHTVRIAPTGRDSGFRPGERVWALDTATMQRSRPLTALGTSPIEGSRDYLLHFKEPVAGRIAAGHILENASLCPKLIVRNCRMLKQNRGRSILVTTPAKVRIEHNYFRSAGAAVLIEGDTELWFESGAVGNVVIRDNLFEDCYTSGNNLIDAPWGWGEGVISISPSFRPADKTTPAYHRNIRIKRNTFRHFDYAVLFARSVEGLTFSRNTLERTRTFKPFYRPWNLCLDGCRKVRIGRNRLSPDFPGRNIRIDHMRASEIIQPGARTFEIFHKQTDR